MTVIAILIYRTLLIAALMYTVGYLGWSWWWLMLLWTIPVMETKEAK